MRFLGTTEITRSSRLSANNRTYMESLLVGLELENPVTIQTLQ